MTSINPAVTALHAQYCATMGIELALTFGAERMWLDASAQGVTTEDIRLCLEARLKSNRQNSYKFGVMIYHLVDGDERIAAVLNEAAVARATKRIKSYAPGKSEILRATGREDQPPQEQARAVSELPLIQALRRAAE